VVGGGNSGLCFFLGGGRLTQQRADSRVGGDGQEKNNYWAEPYGVKRRVKRDKIKETYVPPTQVYFFTQRQKIWWWAKKGEEKKKKGGGGRSLSPWGRTGSLQSGGEVGRVPFHTDRGHMPIFGEDAMCMGENLAASEMGGQIKKIGPGGWCWWTFVGGDDNGQVKVVGGLMAKKKEEGPGGKKALQFGQERVACYPRETLTEGGGG